MGPLQFACTNVVWFDLVSWSAAVEREPRLIMISARQNPDLVFEHFIHQTMFVIYPARPTSGQVVFQPLRVSQTVKRITLHISDQSNDA